MIPEFYSGEVADSVLNYTGNLPIFTFLRHILKTLKYILSFRYYYK